ncbi:MAG: S8 family serine peptidase [Acidobacteria bacterium]|nr:S8 family serine peptidase [Acidobacteriota bacterium]
MRPMTVRHCALITLAWLVALATSPLRAQSGPTVDPLLHQQVNQAPLSTTSVVITYDHQPGATDFAVLTSLGIRGGTVLSRLPMILAAIDKSQLRALGARPEIRSLYANRRMSLMTNESRPFIGLSALLEDDEVIDLNGGSAISGKEVSIAYVDTGIDATHPDLQLGQNVVQNVLFPLAEYSATEMPLDSSFVPIVAIENQPFTDAEGGHGTFGAAVTAGTGQASGEFYGGVAPGAKLVGLVAGNDGGLTTFAIVQAFNYALANQFRYNIRVCNNSWGAALRGTPYNKEDPINIATRALHDNNIVVVFAAGNGIDNVGDVPGAINTYSVAPWVISVGAGEKNSYGTLASFSSRGEENAPPGTDTAGQPADPDAPPNLRPDLIGSGVHITSARSKGAGVTNSVGLLPIFVGGNDPLVIPPAFLPFYASADGTSFATPQVSGVVALMLEANATLTSDEVVTMLRETATPMPYTEREVGAGYVDARNAVRRAIGLGAVDHPANLFPAGIEILDPTGDQIGTTAQDIRVGDFAYDEAADQIVYTLTLTDLSNRKPNNGWTMSSNFSSPNSATTTIFVRAAISETGQEKFTHGKITTLATGTRNQQNLGAVDSGQIVGNQIVIRLARDKVNTAVGQDVLFATSWNTLAQGQILIGTSATGGLLFNADFTSGGSDFKVGEPPPPGVNVDPTSGLMTTEGGGTGEFTIALNSPPATGTDVVIGLSSSHPNEGVPSATSVTFTRANWNVAQRVVVTGVNDKLVDGDIAYQIVTAPAVSADPNYSGLDGPDVSIVNLNDDTPPPPCGGTKVTERFIGSLTTGDPYVDVPFVVRCNDIAARLLFQPDTESISLTLLGPNGEEMSDAGRRADTVRSTALTPGYYTYRVTGPVSQPVDFLIRSVQGNR